MPAKSVDEGLDRTQTPFATAALVALPVRLVLGWTYFSAFWRRVVLSNKLNPDLPGYVGEKFNHFLPHSIGIGPIMEHLMIAFTIVEGIAGACMILGLFTRPVAVIVSALAFGILISAGWLGTTCLDEWQIGILGVAGGLLLFLSGGGHYSLDGFLAARNYAFTRTRMFSWLTSGDVTLDRRAVFAGSIAVLSLTLFTNQYFHGGLYGPLHNKSIAPTIEISDARIDTDVLRFTIYRTDGVDVYGSFLIGVTVTDDTTGKKVVDLNADQLSRLPQHAIANRYIAKVKPGAHSLIVPLGAKADLTMNTDSARPNTDHRYRLTLTDISGAAWSQAIAIGG
jgi:thiosulfate dehydrogenase [quinone] large subunit